MAASRRSNADNPRRISFAKIAEPLEVPQLLALQTDSFDWLVGNERWEQRVAERQAAGEDVSTKSGLHEIFEEISPIEDFSETMSLSFENPVFLDPKYTEEECKEKDFTYSRPLYVSAEFTNGETGEIKGQTVFMGDFPMMTRKGTFIINGTERVVVSQLVRSPGVYFERNADKTSDKDIYTSKVIPSRGAWLEFEIDKRDLVGVRLDRKRKQSVTVLLKALQAVAEADDYVGAPYDYESVMAELRQYESIQLTEEKDHHNTADEALLDIYRKLRPGEPPTREAALTLLKNYYFNPKRYDLAKVGRYKINKKLGTTEAFDQQTLTLHDVVATIRYIVELHAGKEVLVDGQDQPVAHANGEPVEVRADDIDHFGNRRMRTVGELIQNQLRTGLARMERVVRERMTTQDVEAITPQSLINIRPVVAALKEFFGTSQLSQFMDQTNPIAGLTHKRRLSALGPGGISRDRAQMDVRDVHASHYGRMCPIETPEGPNIGLIGSLASYGRINPYGFVETPYRVVVDGQVTNEIHHLTADEEESRVIAQANARLDDQDNLVDERVLVRTRGGEAVDIPREEVEYMDVSPRQMVSVATALIPFLEHDDANRALMGANMQRQAVPLIKSDAPLVGTGMEYRAAVDAGDVVTSDVAGVVKEVSADEVVVFTDEGGDKSYRLLKFTRSNQGTCINQRPLVSEGDRVEIGTPIADGPCTDEGEMALGTNLLVAFMPWQGHNYEDAIILSQRLVQEDVLTSIHIEEHEVDARDTKLGPEEITRDIPNVSDDVLADLDERGIIRVGAEVTTGDILVGKVTPKGETELTPEERLLRAIFGEKAREVRDTSMKVPHGESGTVIGVREFNREDGDELPPGVNQLVRVYVAQKRKISVGDKLAGRHGNKGVIAKILPIEDMPFMEDGTPVDVVLNPLGVPRRMNIGQILELHLGWLAKNGWDLKLADDTSDADWKQRLIKIHAQEAEPDTNVATPVFDGAREDEIVGLLGASRPNRDGVRMVGESGKADLYDGRSGEPFPDPVSVGYMYILKLHHLVDDKIHARSTGPYSMITQQPLGGKAQFGGQRFGEMEVWAMEAYGAAYALQELLTIKSDDVPGRVKVYEAIVKGENIPDSGIPESFKVLVKEMQSLCLNVEVLSQDGTALEMRDAEEDVFRAAEELGIDLSRREPSSVEEV
ncbi:DNA-directed RNA polymerase subunit beta [Nocardioides aequoreus]|uniref:DNA-directed RNA polymerase subunit beta n=1 Tax=Nocardioides aequoreus TaxID=397278 RepID=UPI0004C30E27|nr:DNA-directed RNA polymerase subunit beta [Nocardioides aequoreus]